MSDSALVKTGNPLAIEGLEDLLTESELGASSGFSQQEPGSGQDNPGLATGFSQEVTVERAAEILGLSANAVHKRLRKGTLRGRKVPGKFKDQWLVFLDEKQKPLEIRFEDEPGASSGFSQQGPGSGQDNPGLAAGSRPATTNVEGSELMLLREFMAKIEELQHRNGYLQALLVAERQQVRLLKDSQHKHGWWQRFSAWFLGKST